MKVESNIWAGKEDTEEGRGHRRYFRQRCMKRYLIE
jgi:hypothetical protein